MKKSLPLFYLLPLFVGLITFFSCSRKAYTSSLFEQQTAHHKIVAILPAEMIFTGVQPKNLTPEDIAKVEEEESKTFQLSLFNGVLRYANTRKYFTTINFQDVSTTQKLLEQNNISIRDSWKKDDKELATLLGVDAVVRMRIQKNRYMGDLASYGIGAARQVLYGTGIANRIPLPYVNNKTNDIYASCSVVSNNQTLWNDYYKRGSDYNSPANVIIENITDNFGQHFPYKKRR